MAREKYHDVFVELGTGFIEKICGITVEEFVEFMWKDKELPEHSVERLDFLVEIVKHLEGAYRRWDGSIQKWFRRKRKELGNFSPYQRMKWPGFWASHDSSRQKILELAKSLSDGNAT